MWFLNFIIGTFAEPALLVALITMIGKALSREKISQVIISGIKVAIGFFVIAAGATFFTSALKPFGILFKDLFNLNGALPNNDGLAGWFNDPNLGGVDFKGIAQMGSVIMVISLLLNILLARLSRFKYVYTTGHILFYMSIMLATVFHYAGMDFANNASDYVLTVASASLIMASYMVITCAVVKKDIQAVTGESNISLAHSGNFGYVLSGWIGSSIGKMAKRRGKEVKNADELKFPKWLSILSNGMISMSLTMFITYLAVYLPEGIIYETSGNVSKEAAAVIGTGDNWLVECFVNALKFVAGIQVLLFGVKMAIAELVPAFKGIATRVIKGCKIGLEGAIMLAYGSNTLILGFIFSLLGGILGLVVSIGVGHFDGNVAVILPAMTSHFFIGGVAAIIGNKKGGIWGAILGSLIVGFIFTLVPLFFMLGHWTDPSKMNNLTWSDPDYAIGFIPGLISKLDHGKWIILGFAIMLFGGMSVDGIVHEKRTKKLAKVQ